MLLWICAEFVQSLQVETLGTYPRYSLMVMLSVFLWFKVDNWSVIILTFNWILDLILILTTIFPAGGNNIAKISRSFSFLIPSVRPTFLT